MVVAAWLSQVGSRQNYVTPQDCASSPILSAFDLSALVPSGDQTTQNVALLELIRGASSKVDDYVVGQFGALAATRNVQNGRMTVQPNGSLIFTPEFGPLLKLESLQIGWSLDVLTDVTLNDTTCQIQRFRAIIYPFLAAVGLQLGSMDRVLGMGWARRGATLDVKATYINGWPHTVTTDQSTAGDTTLPDLKQVLGLAAGAQGYIYDGALWEDFQIDPAWDNETLPVPVSAPLQYDHGAGVIVSSLPETIRRATLHFVADELEERGEEGIVLSGAGFESVDKAGGGYTKDHAGEAFGLLDAFAQAWSVPT